MSYRHGSSGSVEHGFWLVLGVAHAARWATHGGLPWLVLGLVVVVSWRVGRRLLRRLPSALHRRQTASNGGRSRLGRRRA